jgi:hypothetical protein
VRRLGKVLLLVGGLGLGLGWLFVSLRPPSDASLIRNLEEHREVFARLVQMIREDQGLERVDDDWTEPSEPTTVGVSPQRIAEYRRLFAEAGVPRGFYSFNQGKSIMFVAYASGIAVSGASKSYVYSEEPLMDLVDGPLDPYHAGRKVAVVRRIEDHWYLEFTST